jgi:hypothetical protein
VFIVSADNTQLTAAQNCLDDLKIAEVTRETVGNVLQNMIAEVLSGENNYSYYYPATSGRSPDPITLLCRRPTGPLSCSLVISSPDCL